METHIDEVGDGIYRLSTFVSRGGTSGLTFCEYLVDAEEPLLFHCGHRQRFALGSAALARVMPVERLTWISYSHAEADEAGALNEWLGAAPNATAFHGRIGCNIWLTDAAIRPPRPVKEDESIDLGGKRVRFIPTPHLPHCWDAGVLYEETTGTLFCSDLFAQSGEVALFSDGDILSPAIAAEEGAHATAVTPNTGPTIRKLARLQPQRLALMHGPVFTGDCAASLNALADYFDGALNAARGLNAISPGGPCSAGSPC